MILAHIFGFAVYALAALGLFVLLGLFFYKPQAEPEIDPTLFPPPRPATDRVYIVHFTDRPKAEMRLAQIHVGQQFLSFYGSDGGLRAVHAVNAIQSIEEK